MTSRILKGGLLYHDTPVGVICLQSGFAKPRGHVRNPRTFNFPVVQKVVEEVDIPTLLFKPTPELLKPFIDAAKQLEQEGVQAITGSCGFLARFQTRLAESVNIPVCVSSLLQIPLVRLMHGPAARVGVLTASSKALTQDHFNAIGMPIEDFVIRGMEGYREFWEVIIDYKRNDIDMAQMEKEVCDSAQKLAQEGQLDALVLECTDLSAFARPIQETVKLPVYDIDSLVEYMAYSVCRKNY